LPVLEHPLFQQQDLSLHFCQSPLPRRCNQKPKPDFNHRFGRSLLIASSPRAKKKKLVKPPLVFGLCLDEQLSHEDSTAPLTGTGATGTGTGEHVTGGEHDPVCGTFTCGETHDQECPPCSQEIGNIEY